MKQKSLLIRASIQKSKQVQQCPGNGAYNDLTKGTVCDEEKNR